jgi:hypothetical protein
MTGPSEKDPRHAAFEKLVLDRLDQAQQLIGYPFTTARVLIQNVGAVQAARILLNPNEGKIHDGLQALCHHELGHFSVEQAVIDFEDRTVFTDDERSTAKARLYYANKNAGGQT